MKCSEFNLYWRSKDEIFPTCKADPNWPAPCEYDEGNYDEDEEVKDEYTLADLGYNWW